MLASLEHRLDAWLLRMLYPDGAAPDDFLRPHNEPALATADSVSWRVFKNPLALFVGGVTAVILELAEARVRSGVWEHTRFREHPLERMRRTGHASMMTVYGPRSATQAMIRRVASMHARIVGVTPCGQPYCAADAPLLDWVYATASYGFLEAYHAYVNPLDARQRDSFYAEGRPASVLYGATSAPGSQDEMLDLFERMRGRIERSDIVFEFLQIMMQVAVLPRPLRAFQHVLLKAAVQTVPAWIRDELGLDERWNLPAWQRRWVCGAGALADRLLLAHSPAVLACRRLGLPDDHLYPVGRRHAKSPLE